MSVESSPEIHLVVSTYSFFPFENNTMSQAIWMLINHISWRGEIIPNLSCQECFVVPETVWRKKLSFGWIHSRWPRGWCSRSCLYFSSPEWSCPSAPNVQLVPVTECRLSCSCAAPGCWHWENSSLLSPGPVMTRGLSVKLCLCCSKSYLFRYDTR